MKTKNTLPFVGFVVLICVMTLLCALADGNTPCDESDCDGTYVNGFCTENDEHFQAPTQTTDADGKKVYEVGNAGQLYWIAAQTNNIGNTFSRSTVKLTNDIVVNPGTFDADGNYTPVDGETPRLWTPISGLSTTQGFRGNFDGDGHTVSGLYMNGSTEFVYVGLIGNLAAMDVNCSVQDVGIINSYMSCSFGSSPRLHYIGGVVGYAYCSEGQIIISNCYNDGIIDEHTTGYNSHKYYVGGVVGCTGNRGGTIIIANCNNTGAISTDITQFLATNIGGVVGCNDLSITNGKSESTTIMTNCFNSGEIVCNSTTGYYYIGGIVGYCSIKNNANLIVKLCYNTSIIENSGSNNYIGGVMGYCYEGTDTSVNISDCFYKLDYNDADQEFDHKNLYGIGGCYNASASNENVDRGTQPVADDVSVDYMFDDEDPTKFWSIAFGDGSLAYFMNKRFAEYYALLEDTSPLYEFYSKETENIEDFSTTICYPWKQTLNRAPSDKYPLLNGPTVKYDDANDIYYNDAIAIAPRVKGAQIRTDGKYGLRFGFVYDGSKEAIAEYDEGSISYGVLLVPNEIKGDNCISLSNLEALNEKGIEVANVAKELDSNDTDENAIIYTAVVYDIPYVDENNNKYDIEIVAIPYVTYSINDVQYTSYGASITRSVNQVKQIIDGGWSMDNNA